MKRRPSIHPDAQAFVALARKALDPVYERLSRWTPPPPPGGKITCGKGCGACCTMLFEVTFVEAVGVIAWFLDDTERLHWLPDALASAAQREAELRFFYGRSAGFDTRRDLGPCPLFVYEDTEDPHKGHCGVYAARPLICRSFFAASDPVLCRPGAPPGRVVFHARPVVEEAWEKIETVLPTVRETFVPFDVALRWAAHYCCEGRLPPPEEYGRWLEASLADRQRRMATVEAIDAQLAAQKP